MRNLELNNLKKRRNRKMKNEKLKTENVVWKRHSDNERYFYVEKDDKIILLRMNNFPDEPLYTLINGLDILDIEDKPNNWVISIN
jgi:hypothetical protein